MMTEVLLNSTDEEVYSVCKEAVSDALLVRQSKGSSVNTKLWFFRNEN